MPLKTKTIRITTETAQDEITALLGTDVGSIVAQYRDDRTITIDIVSNETIEYAFSPSKQCPTMSEEKTDMLLWILWAGCLFGDIVVYLKIKNGDGDNDNPFIIWFGIMLSLALLVIPCAIFSEHAPPQGY